LLLNSNAAALRWNSDGLSNSGLRSWILGQVEGDAQLLDLRWLTEFRVMFLLWGILFDRWAFLGLGQDLLIRICYSDFVAQRDRFYCC
jgi:hypothetical protein